MNVCGNQMFDTYAWVIQCKYCYVTATTKPLDYT